MLRPFDTYTNAEIARWVWLRAIEWSNWPVFLSQAILPLLLILYPWYSILIALFCVKGAWMVIQRAFISVRLSEASCLFVVWLKWPAAIGSSIYLFLHGRYGVGVLALLWPLIAAFVCAPAGLVFRLLGLSTSIGSIELALAKRIGFVDQKTSL